MPPPRLPRKTPAHEASATRRTPATHGADSQAGPRQLAHQVEIYHSIIQRKVLAPNDFNDIVDVARTLNPISVGSDVRVWPDE